MLTIEAIFCFPNRKPRYASQDTSLTEEKEYRFSLFYFISWHYFFDEIKTQIIPKIKGVRIDNFVRFLETETENEVNYLPYNYKELTMNRQWIIICVTPYNLSIKGKTFEK